MYSAFRNGDYSLNFVTRGQGCYEVRSTSRRVFRDTLTLNPSTNWALEIQCTSWLSLCISTDTTKVYHVKERYASNPLNINNFRKSDRGSFSFFFEVLLTGMNRSCICLEVTKIWCPMLLKEFVFPLINLCSGSVKPTCLTLHSLK